MQVAWISLIRRKFEVFAKFKLQRENYGGYDSSYGGLSNCL